MALEVGLGEGMVKRLADTTKVAVHAIRGNSDTPRVWWGREFDGK